MLLKKIFWFWWRKKKSDSEFMSYNLMLYSGNKIRAWRGKQNIYSNSRVVRKKTMPPPPPLCKLNGRSLIEIQWRHDNIKKNWYHHNNSRTINWMVIVWECKNINHIHVWRKCRRKCIFKSTIMNGISLLTWLNSSSKIFTLSAN